MLEKVYPIEVSVTRKDELPGQGNRGRKVIRIHQCNHCSEEFQAERKKAKFCSLRCSKDFYIERARPGTCSECGDDFVRKIISNGYTRRETCSKSCENKKRANSIDYDSPQRSRKLSQSCKERKAHLNMHTPEIRKSNGPLISEAKTGVNNIGRAVLGEPKSHKEVTFISPDGLIYTTMCVRGFVRDNHHLFNEEDIARRPNQKSSKSTLEGNMTCRAMSGLTSVGNESKGGWKGWRKML